MSTGGIIFLKSQFILFKSTDVSHSMARANLNKSEDLVTNTTQHQSTYLGDPESTSIEIPLSDPNLLSKSTSKCEHFETNFNS